MYRITAKNVIVGYTETVDYCYRLPSGAPQVIGRKERTRGETATGVIYRGVVYNLPGHNDFAGAETASAAEIDAGAVATQQRGELATQQAAQADTDEQTVELAYRLARIELEVM